VSTSQIKSHLGQNLTTVRLAFVCQKKVKGTKMTFFATLLAARTILKCFMIVFTQNYFCSAFGELFNKCYCYANDKIRYSNDKLEKNLWKIINMSNKTASYLKNSI
jgi:hypothetical protein